MKPIHPLKRIRLSRGLTIEGFAKKLGVTKQAIWMWETGKAVPRAKMYPQIAKLLHITPIEVTEMFFPSQAEA